MRQKKNTIQHVSTILVNRCTDKMNLRFPNELENVLDSEMHTYAVSSVIKYVLTSKLIYRVHHNKNIFSMKAEVNFPEETR